MKTLSNQTHGEAAILQRIIRPEERRLSVSAARGILRLDFDEQDRKRMHELAEKNQEGELSAEESGQLDDYLRVGLFLDLIHSKARRCLKAAARSSRR